MKTPRRTLVALAVFLFAGSALRAHDFWIEPSSFSPAPGQRISLRLRVGQSFQGDPVPRIPAFIQRFDSVGAGGPLPVIGLPGRDPAGYAAFPAPGLQWIVYGGTPEKVELAGPKFESYLAEEGLESISALRAKRGQTAAGVKEQFSRCAKAVIAVPGAGDAGKGAAFDAVLGLTLELVPEANPTALKPGAELPVRLLYRGKPLAGALVIALPRDRPAEKVSARTDAKGRVRLRLDHAATWLVKAVHMTPAPAGSGADWESFWASLTFASAAAP